MPSKPHIYVVDDEAIIASTLATILRRCGYTVSAFTNPLDAIANMECQPPQALITDVVMPQLSGVQLALQITKKCPNCKVLLFSGQADSCDLLKDARANGHTFQLFCKPVAPSRLINALTAELAFPPKGEAGVSAFYVEACTGP